MRHLVEYALIVAVVGLLTGCNRKPTVQEAWQRDDQVESRERGEVLADRKAPDVSSNGFHGEFACHTADGGCLHLTCATKVSCDYMAKQELRCASPKVLDPHQIVDDKYCKSETADEPVSTNQVIVGGGTPFAMGTATAGIFYGHN